MTVVGKHYPNRLGQGCDRHIATVVHLNNPIDFADLCDLAGGIPKATVSRCLRRLERLGVVVVLINPHDKRLRIVEAGINAPSSLPQPDTRTAQAVIGGAA